MIGLIMVAVSVVIATAALIGTGHTVPDGMVALGSASVGALATLMTTHGGSTGEPPTMSGTPPTRA